MRKRYLYGSILSIIGIIDAGYLTIEHFSGKVPQCIEGSILAECGKVLTSQYSQIGGIPVALLGLLYYAFLLALSIIAFKRPHNARYGHLLRLVNLAGVAASAYFVYLQLAVLNAICIYCMTSAVDTFILCGVLNVRRLKKSQSLAVEPAYETAV